MKCLSFVSRDVNKSVCIPTLPWPHVLLLEQVSTSRSFEWKLTGCYGNFSWRMALDTLWVGQSLWNFTRRLLRSTDFLTQANSILVGCCLLAITVFFLFLPEVKILDRSGRSSITTKRKRETTISGKLRTTKMNWERPSSQLRKYFAIDQLIKTWDM